MKHKEHFYNISFTYFTFPDVFIQDFAKHRFKLTVTVPVCSIHQNHQDSRFQRRIWYWTTETHSLIFRQYQRRQKNKRPSIMNTTFSVATSLSIYNNQTVNMDLLKKTAALLQVK